MAFTVLRCESWRLVIPDSQETRSPIPDSQETLPPEDEAPHEPTTPEEGKAPPEAIIPKAEGKPPDSLGKTPRTSRLPTLRKGADLESTKQAVVDLTESPAKDRSPSPITEEDEKDQAATIKENEKGPAVGKATTLERASEVVASLQDHMAVTTTPQTDKVLRRSTMRELDKPSPFAKKHTMASDSFDSSGDEDEKKSLFEMVHDAVKLNATDTVKGFTRNAFAAVDEKQKKQLLETEVVDLVANSMTRKKGTKHTYFKVARLEGTDMKRVVKEDYLLPMLGVTAAKMVSYPDVKTSEEGRMLLNVRRLRIKDDIYNLNLNALRSLLRFLIRKGEEKLKHFIKTRIVIFRDVDGTTNWTDLATYIIEDTGVENEYKQYLKACVTLDSALVPPSLLGLTHPPLLRYALEEKITAHQIMERLLPEEEEDPGPDPPLMPQQGGDGGVGIDIDGTDVPPAERSAQRVRSRNKKRLFP